MPCTIIILIIPNEEITNALNASTIIKKLLLFILIICLIII
jgi:Mn2+/Fe2+ NRAMP family transporter